MPLVKSLISRSEKYSYDAVLMFGPMYHILDRQKRIEVLKNVLTYLKPAGLLFAAYIMRFASAIDGFFDDLVADPTFVEIVEITDW